MATGASAQTAPRSVGLGGNVIRPGIPRGGSAGPGLSGVPNGVPSASPVLGPVPFSSLGRAGGINPGTSSFGSSAGFPQGASIQGRARGRGYGGTVVVPFGITGFGYGNAGPGYSPQPGAYDPIFGVYAPGITYWEAPGQQTPTVVINQNFAPDTARPRMLDYSNVDLPPANTANARPNGGGNASINDDQPTIYLVALTDHTVMPAVAYWVEGDTLHYITTQGSHNRATLQLVDRAMTKRLNDERGIAFKLPAQQ
jgi:hypothetical protein